MPRISATSLGLCTVLTACADRVPPPNWPDPPPPTLAHPLEVEDPQRGDSPNAEGSSSTDGPNLATQPKPVPNGGEPSEQSDQAGAQPAEPDPPKPTRQGGPGEFPRSVARRVLW